MILKPAVLLFQTFKGSTVRVRISAVTTLEKHKKIPEPSLIIAAPFYLRIVVFIE